MQRVNIGVKMKNIVNDKLNEIERKENIKILHCVESGSRAWGFASPDSDYDVRFIYLRPRDFYLRLDKTRDVIEWQLDPIIDMNGWDLQKALKLLHDSNPTLFEWNSSPVVYRTTDEWKRVSSVINDYYIRKSGLYHYLNMAKDNYREYLKADRVRLKKYFYVLRPILACKWILDRGTPPPMLFNSLLDAYMEKSLRPAVDKLLESKINAPERETGKRIEEIHEYIELNLAEIEERIGTVPDDGRNDWNELNHLFLNMLESMD